MGHAPSGNFLVPYALQMCTRFVSVSSRLMSTYTTHVRLSFIYTTHGMQCSKEKWHLNFDHLPYMYYESALVEATAFELSLSNNCKTQNLMCTQLLLDETPLISLCLELIESIHLYVCLLVILLAILINIHFGNHVFLRYSLNNLAHQKLFAYSVYLHTHNCTILSLYIIITSRCRTMRGWLIWH